jgi:hypothetical protein
MKVESLRRVLADRFGGPLRSSLLFYPQDSAQDLAQDLVWGLLRSPLCDPMWNSLAISLQVAVHAAAIKRPDDES